ncbi:MAG: DedA family protein [Thermoleophilia bacterium]|nr:DedA family protein [Thermoleophilia bacterium]
METILGPLFDATESLVLWGGVSMVFVLMVLESACIPVPSELIMLLAGGVLVTQGEASMFAVVTAGVLGNVIGSVLCWQIGYRGGRPFIDRHGRWVRLNHHHVELAERWFTRWGAPTVLVSRCLPIVRTFISLPAGIAGMPLGRFTLYTTLGCVPWVWALAAVGNHLGENWQDARDTLHRFDYLIVAAIGLGILWLVARHLRTRRAADANA